MSGVFSQIYIHLVFAVKNRDALIHPDWEVTLHKYLTTTIERRGHKLLAIGGMPDHIHIFIGQKPADPLSNLVRELKKASTKFIMEKRLSTHEFKWQSGYGAFSYSRSQIDSVCRYVLNQKEHHKVKSFKEEYLKILKDFEIKPDKRNLFDFY